MSCEPWQCAEIAATKKANSIPKPEIAVAMIQKAARPIIIAGSNLTERFMEGRPAIDFIIDLAKASKVPVIATAHMVGEFIKRGYQPAAFMNAMEIGQRVVDPTWMGIDGKGHPDLVIMVGMPYYMQALILSGLKHFAPTLKTMTLDNMYHVHASWSFPNASLETWANNLKVMTTTFGGN
ncbi:MAG: CO dehydrogenase/acetyl-CoA synthase complex subunit epsilon [Candidatus Bathyarchaeota archaeon]|nr:CO dehydrogenase/acetyl-CoA synthase complex subunit epsilon [Candidatus Termiticorpusculum sp.]MCL1971163.1 CO dehydrogenase/acetyl-CoA synthase complex subunit epsilon [Candidatus Termiticorpusculum sp.]